MKYAEIGKITVTADSVGPAVITVLENGLCEVESDKEFNAYAHLSSTIVKLNKEISQLKSVIDGSFDKLITSIIDALDLDYGSFYPRPHDVLLDNYLKLNTAYHALRKKLPLLEKAALDVAWEEFLGIGLIPFDEYIRDDLFSWVWNDDNGPMASNAEQSRITKHMLLKLQNYKSRKYTLRVFKRVSSYLLVGTDVRTAIEFDKVI